MKLIEEKRLSTTGYYLLGVGKEPLSISIRGEIL